MPTITNTNVIHFLFLYFFAAISLSGCGGGGGDSEPAAPIISLNSLTVTNVGSTLRVSETFQLTATGTYSNASTRNLTSLVTWSVENAGILEVSNNGLVTAISAGTTTVTASFEGQSFARVISVKALLGLSISPNTLTLAIAGSEQLSVIGQYTDNSTETLTSTLTWESSDSDVASISSSGLVLAVSAGTVSVTASAAGISETIQVTVNPTLDSLSVTNILSTLKVSETFQLAVTGTYSDASTQDLSASVTWSVADPAILEVSNTGLVTALSAGSTAVTASFQGLSTQQDISVKALAQLSISPTTLTLAIASSQQLSVTGIYTDNSNEVVDNLVTWQSSAANIASVSNTGAVLGISAGAVSISANIDAISSSVSVTISPASLQSIVINPPIVQIASGLTYALSAKGIYSDGTEQNLSDQVSWSVSDSSIASIDPETGLLRAIQAGTVLVNAGKEGLNTSVEITVSQATLSGIAITPSNISLAKGSIQQVNVTAIFSDNTKLDVSRQVEWLNSNEQIAIIEDDSSGVLALLEGSTTLSASLSGQQANLLVNVTDAELVSLSVYPVNASLPIGLSQQYSAQGTYSDGTIQDLSGQVTWLSSNDGQVLISNTEPLAGLAESIAIGSVTISAVFSGIQQETSLTIVNAELSSIEIKPANQVLAKGSDAEIKALGYYTDGSVIDLTSKVIWSASNSSLVDLSSASNGRLLSLNEGSALISAALGGISTLANITVSTATLESISINATQTTLPSGLTQRLTAIGTYSDMSTKDLSQQVSWQSDNVQIATVSNNNAQSGLLKGISPGQLTISARLGLLSEDISIDVTNAVLTSIEVMTTSSQLNVTSSGLATAIATFSDSTTQDVSSQVNWLSSDINIASIGNTDANKGVLQALSAGTVNISASLDGINSSFVSLEITLNPNLPKVLSLSVQPNLILNDGNDTAQVRLVIVPSAEDGVIADGTPITLTITEGETNRDISLVTMNGEAIYALQSSYDGFISLSAAASNYSVSSGVLSTGALSDALLATGRARVVYEDNTLKTGSIFLVLLRNLTNRPFNIEQINIGYLDPNNGNAFVNFSESPVTQGSFISDGDLTAGEFNYIGYELDNDIEASIYVISYLFSDEQSGESFRLDATFNFAQ